MALLRRCRVNAALTIQLFSQLFHFINMWVFNRIVADPLPNYCTRYGIFVWVWTLWRSFFNSVDKFWFGSQYSHGTYFVWFRMFLFDFENSGLVLTALMELTLFDFEYWKFCLISKTLMVYFCVLIGFCLILNVYLNFWMLNFCLIIFFLVVFFYLNSSIWFRIFWRLFLLDFNFFHMIFVHDVLFRLDLSGFIYTYFVSSRMFWVVIYV